MWDVSNVIWLISMFESCETLESICDIERWKLPSNAYLTNMFENSAINPIPSWYTK